MVFQFHILAFLGHKYLQVIRRVVFITGLAEEEQLLVVFPFGRIVFVGGLAGLDCLEFTVENGSKVLELAFYVFNCKTATQTSL